MCSLFPEGWAPVQAEPFCPSFVLLADLVLSALLKFIHYGSIRKTSRLKRFDIKAVAHQTNSACDKGQLMEWTSKRIWHV